MIPKYRISLELFENPLDYGDISIIQIGKMHCKPGNIIEKHVHTDFYELTIISDGKGAMLVNDTVVPISAGDVLLSLPCDVHGISSDPEQPLRYFFFAFRLKGGLYKDDFENISQNNYAPTKRAIKSNEISTLIGNTITELTNKNMYSDELISLYLQEIIIDTIREFNKATNRSAPDFAKNADALCYYIMNYIDTHLYTIKNLNELSGVLDYSYGYLSTVFKKTVGYSISDYYGNKKSEAAKSLISENRLTISRISELLNYSSPFAFSNAFKKKYGCSPKAFRESGGTDAKG